MGLNMMVTQLVIESVLYSIIIPLYCEGKHLKILLEKIQNQLDLLGEAFELILVDDGSTDNTWMVIAEESKKYPTLRAVQFSRNFGKESAICAGMEMARGDVVIVMDGDMQHPPEVIPEMVRIWRESGADIVEAIKIKRGKEPVINKIGASMFYAIMNKVSGYDLRGASDFKLLNRKVINEWLKMGEHNLFFRGMVAWLGFKYVQIPFEVKERASGETKWSILRRVKLATIALSGFSTVPLHFITIIGALFMVFAIILGGHTLFQKVSGRAVSGFTTVIILLLMIGSLLMISLGIIGEYISRIFEEVKGRPRYIVSKSIDTTGRNNELV